MVDAGTDQVNDLTRPFGIQFGRKTYEIFRGVLTVLRASRCRATIADIGAVTRAFIRLRNQISQRSAPRKAPQLMKPSSSATIPPRRFARKRYHMM